MNGYLLPCQDASCSAASCPFNCALQVVDSLLGAQTCVRGEEVDLLLDFRSLLRHGSDADSVLQLFFQLRRAMEARHYVAFYRLRRWIENHIYARVRLTAQSEERLVEVSLNRYCIEAIRSGAVLRARQPDEPLLGARVRFEFRATPPDTKWQPGKQVTASAA